MPHARHDLRPAFCGQLVNLGLLGSLWFRFSTEQRNTLLLCVILLQATLEYVRTQAAA
jgi:hypothetical protein